MMRDYSVNLYVTDTNERSPESCDELEFIVRAASLQQAFDLALKKKEEAQAWNRFRVFEADAQEIRGKKRALLGFRKK
jgi:hypothetical protein